jgi:hypothetical protein
LKISYYLHVLISESLKRIEQILRGDFETCGWIILIGRRRRRREAVEVMKEKNEGGSRVDESSQR